VPLFEVGGMSDESAPQLLQTLLRGLSVLEIVATANEPATAKSIARMLGIPVATCYHLLRTLVAGGYLIRAAGGTYEVGPQGGRLGYHLERKFGPPPEVSALLMRLRNRTGETAYVSGLRHGTITMQQLIPGNGPVSVGNLDVGYSADLHARASCLSVLAYLPPELVRTMLAGTVLAPLTPNTVTSFADLVKRLAHVRKAGYAIDREEFVEGVCCVSAPFFDADDQPLGSFTVSVAASKFPAHRGELISAVTEAASLATRLKRTGALPAQPEHDSQAGHGSQGGRSALRPIGESK
jgi:DNA-binding IclR family transcriptional regulator